MAKKRSAIIRLGLQVSATALCAPAAWAQTQLPAQAEAPVQAQAADGDSPGVAEVVVTAERREQNLQKTPLTIQVLSGDQMLAAGVSRFDDLNRVTTGVQIGMFGPSTTVFIRGVGAATGTPLINPGVTFNVDNVYIGRPDGMDGYFYDVERIEVLKGPQGTLYGRNANGGAINLITKDARLGTNSADLTLEAGNYDYRRATGALNLAIGTRSALRVAANIVHRDGYLSDGTVDDVKQSVRLRFKTEFSPDVTLRLNGDYTHLGGKGTGYVYIRPGVDPYTAVSDPSSNAYRRAFSVAGSRVSDQLPDSHQNTELYGVSAQLDWRLGDFATLTVLPAYRRNEIRTLVYATQRQDTNATDEQTSLEVRLGNSSRDLTWTVGGFYYHDVQGGGLNVFAGPAVLSRRNVYEPTTKAYAIFGQATYSLSDRFRLIGGARYTSEDDKAHVAITNLLVTPPPTAAYDAAKKFDAFTYKVGAELDLSPRNMLYLTYSTGFKAGGFSQAAPPLTIYGPERLRAAELGSRNRFFGNRLQLNASAFYWKYLDLQDTRLTVDSTGVPSPVIFNSGDAEIYGFSMDVIARPTAKDTLSFNAEFNQSRYLSYFYQTPAASFTTLTNGCPVTGPYAPGAPLPYTDVRGNVNTGTAPILVGDCSGFQVARTPKWTGIVSYDRVFPLASGADFTFSGSVKYTGARWLRTEFVAVERDPKYAVVDASLTYHSPGNGWQLSLWGRNLTKSVYYTGGVMAPNVPGLFNANIGAPRTVGIRASFKFGQ